MAKTSRIRIKIDGLDQLGYAVEALDAEALRIAAMGVYKAAGYVADAITNEAKNIPTEPFRWADESNPRWPTEEEKAILTSHAAGIAPFKNTGESINTSIGYGHYYDGYVRLYYGSKDHYSTVPIQALMNSINHGTSFMKPTNYVKKAVSRAKPEAEAILQQFIDGELKALLLKHLR